jgi:hypothetical protein
MIYEGNDLEDDYSDVVQRPDMSGTIPLSRGTLVEALERMMWTIKRQSVIHRFQRGQITWRPPSGDGADPYVVDGVRLVYPLYHSERLGPRLFSGTYVDLAGKSADYVDGHWNRSALESVFRDMKALADEHGFDVVVITAPTASRLHGPYFDNFPRISERPYFLDFVRELADSAGFPAIDLYASMKPLAGEELFYFRDDDHFNRRGNAVAAELIAEELLAAER